MIDLYYLFENVFEVWGCLFGVMKIGYKGTIMRLDLCDRVGKYFNGFCYWLMLLFKKIDGMWVLFELNFILFVMFDEIGSGNIVLMMLMYEGGYVAYFVNIV